MTIRPDDTDVLLVIDVQNDFLPGGALTVPDGDAVLEPIAALSAAFRHVVVTQDWHPANHVSFASNHFGRSPFETVTLPYGEQVLWPDHCIAGTRGADFSPAFDTTGAQLVLRKGHHRTVDSYSAFREADRRTQTGLAGYLRERGLRRIFCAGLATDFCVAWSAVDAAELGFESHVVLEACRAIDSSGSLDRAMRTMATAGVRFV